MPKILPQARENTKNVTIITTSENRFHKKCVFLANYVPTEKVICTNKLVIDYRSWINDDLMQDSNTKFLIFDIPVRLNIFL